MTLRPRSKLKLHREEHPPADDARFDQNGFAPLTTMLGVSLLMIPVLLLVLTLPTWVERTVDARDTAAQAARTLVTSDTWQTGVAAAQETVIQETDNDGLNPSDVTATFTGSLTPGSTVTATITVTIPAGTVPGIGAFATVHYSASSTQHVDTYRSQNP